MPVPLGTEIMSSLFNYHLVYKSMNITFGKVVLKLLGVVAFFSSWAFFIWFDGSSNTSGLFSLVLVTLGLGLAYSLLHHKKYPIQTISVVFVVEFLLYQIFGYNQTAESIVGSYFYGVNLLGGSVYAIFGSVISQGFVKIFSPLQTRFEKEGVNLSIQVIAGAVGFLICFCLLAVRR